MFAEPKPTAIVHHFNIWRVVCVYFLFVFSLLLLPSCTRFLPMDFFFFFMHSFDSLLGIAWLVHTLRRIDYRRCCETISAKCRTKGISVKRLTNRLIACHNRKYRLFSHKLLDQLRLLLPTISSLKTHKYRTNWYHLHFRALNVKRIDDWFKRRSLNSNVSHNEIHSEHYSPAFLQTSFMAHTANLAHCWICTHEKSHKRQLTIKNF